MYGPRSVQKCKARVNMSLQRSSTLPKGSAAAQEANFVVETERRTSAEAAQL